MMVSAVGPEKKMLHSKMVSPAHETLFHGMVEVDERVVAGKVFLEIAGRPWSG